MKLISSATFMFILGFALFLTSCDGVTPIPNTKTPLTQTPTIQPTFVTFTPAPNPTDGIIPPKDGEQVYTDPDGLYSFNIPTDLKPGDKPNHFSGQAGSFETGYLPEFASARLMNICAWLANVEVRPEDSQIGFVSKRSNANQFNETLCTASGLEINGSFHHISYLIGNSGADDPQHRIIYIKCRDFQVTAEQIALSFSWLHPAHQATPEASSTPFDAEDAAFWNNAAPIPADISVTENSTLIEKTKLSERSRSPIPTPRKTTLQEIGYEYRVAQKNGYKTGNDIALYHNGKMLFNNVIEVSDVYHYDTASGPINAFIAGIRGADIGLTNQPSFYGFLIENDLITPWVSYFPGFNNRSTPILYHDELLWEIVAGGTVKIIKSNQDVVYTLKTYEQASLSSLALQSWDGHWILQVGDFLVQDGELLNKKLGFPEIL